MTLPRPTSLTHVLGSAFWSSQILPPPPRSSFQLHNALGSSHRGGNIEPSHRIFPLSTITLAMSLISCTGDSDSSGYYGGISEQLLALSTSNVLQRPFVILYQSLIFFLYQSLPRTEPGAQARLKRTLELIYYRVHGHFVFFRPFTCYLRFYIITFLRFKGIFCNCFINFLFFISMY